MTRTLKAAAAALLAIALPHSAIAQSFPTKPVHIVVAFAPGGPVDVVARLVATRLPDMLGQSVVVENRPGAGGNLATATVAKAAPDGYTLLAQSSAYAVNPTLSPNPGYDPERDLAPLVQIATQPNLIVVHADFSARSLSDLLNLARTQKLAYASPGSGTTPHLTAEHLFRVIAKSDIVHIPHKGAGPAATAVVSGQPPIGSLAVTAPIPHVRSGRLRALAISSTKRHPQLPDVPTFTELGYPQIQDYTWVGLFAPGGTPKEVVARLNEAVNKVLAMPAIRERLESLTFEPIGGSSEDFTTYVRGEVAKWGKVVRETGARAD